MKKALKSSAKKRILVTGGAGFVGSHIVDEYIALGHTVSIIDNFSTGSPSNVNPKAHFYKVDIRDASAVSAVISKERPQIINHQAAVASITLSTKRPLETYEVNTLGTINLLIAGGETIEKFIFASSGGAIYGRPTKMPTPETVPPAPITPYGFSKQLAEEAVRYYAKEFGFDFTILRPSNIYGPRQNSSSEGGVFAIFSRLAYEQQVPTIYKKTATRDYVFVGDIVKANVLAISKGKKETVNLSTGKEISNQKVYSLLTTALNWQAKPIYKPARDGEVARSCLSPKKALKVLGWKPTVFVEKGVLSLIKQQDA